MVGATSAQILDLAAGSMATIAGLPSGSDYDLWDNGKIFAKKNDDSVTRITLVDAIHGTTLIRDFAAPAQTIAAEFSADLNRVFVLNQSNVARLLSVRPTTERTNPQTPTELLAAACDKVRSQPEFDEQHLYDLCPPAAATAGSR